MLHYLDKDILAEVLGYLFWYLNTREEILHIAEDNGNQERVPMGLS